ncbi:hypothetical protein JR316_0001931 [Psilocybe cubensis]|uniref:DUF6533 domain-containing protein n=2 Tax=Psilocybe cubensis TaxID=181762 RepID=A0A8H7Y6W3_PSICU|nr:hypothetical protein JR316_0001931 [Psilocybe cubensis]KAH9485027.1 hypothetical protein JR316_0001931 [Psilocybe cubensis]
MNTLRGASYAGLAFSTWEILITLQDEVDLMWMHPRRWTIITLLYFFVRYFALAVSVSNTILATILEARYPVSREICRLWLSYQALSVYLLLGAVDVILMIRVYAFYNRRRWIGRLMLALVFLRISLSSASAVMTVPDQEFNETCLNKDVPSVVMYFFIMGEFLIQSVILGLTVWKHLVALRAGWASTPLVALLCRDGATTFTVIIGVLIGTLVYARLEYMHDSAHAVFPSFISILSCVGCRLIIGMQKLAANVMVPEAALPTDSHEFTTIIESLWTRTPSIIPGTSLARTSSIQTGLGSQARSHSIAS